MNAPIVPWAIATEKFSLKNALLKLVVRWAIKCFERHGMLFNLFSFLVVNGLVIVKRC